MNDTSDYDSRFLEFSQSIDPDHPLYPVRDLLFNSFYYKQIGHQTSRRHRLGMFSWLAWAFINGKSIGWKNELLPANTKESCYLDLLIGGHSGAHWMTLRPIAEDAIKGGVTVRLWALGEFQDMSVDSVWNRCEVHIVSTLTQSRRAPFRLILAAAIASFKLGSRLGFPMFGIRTSQMADALMNYLVWKNAWGRLLDPVGCTTSLVTSEASSVNKAFVHASVETGAKTCHFCHGLPFETHTVTAATDLFAFSRIDAMWFSKRVPAKTRIHSIGNPRMVSTRNQVEGLDMASLHRPLRILFFSNGLENPYTMEQEAQDLAILKLPGEIRVKTILRVRPHPRELRQVLEASLIRADLTYELSENQTLADDLRWADICGTPWSTALIEAIVCEKPCFWINARNDRMVRTGEYIDAGVGTLVMHANEWEAIIRDFIDHPETAERYRLRGDRLRETGLIPPCDDKGWYQGLMESIRKNRSEIS